MPYINYNDKKIFYQIKEAEPKDAIVFVHGSGENSNTWKHQFNLKVSYKIIAIDLPSHNESESFDNLSLDLYVDVVKTLVDTLELENIVLCGHSLGGAVIQSYYFKYPSDVAALILVGTGARLRVSPLILEMLKNNYQEYLENIMMGFYRKTSKEIVDDVKGELLKTDPTVTYNDFKICDGFDTLDKTSSINIPCLVLVGKADTFTPVKYSEFFRKKIETSELVIIEKAGHMVMIEKPQEVNKAIESFIRKLPR